MILRRITEHVKAQNWFAVGIDFVIVVVGVFIGLQVSNWNDSMRDRLEEKRLLAQLEMDVSAALELKTEWVTQTGRHRQSLAAAVSVIQNDPDQQMLSKEYCDAMWSSHIIIYPTSKMVTLEEMLSTGGLGIIRNNALRSALLEYQDSRDAMKETNTFIRNDLANVVDEYADAFPRRLVDQHSDANLLGLRQADDTGRLSDSTIVMCQADIIRADQTIQNKLLSNLARTDGLLRLAANEIAAMGQIELALKNDSQ